MGIKKYLKIVFPFVICSILGTIAKADLLWTSQPIGYKRHYEIQTHSNTVPNIFTGTNLTQYVTYVIDSRYSIVLYFNNTYSCNHAQIAHEQAEDWVIKKHAHLGIVIPETHENNNAIRKCKPSRSAGFPPTHTDIPHFEELREEKSQSEPLRPYKRSRIEEEELFF